MNTFQHLSFIEQIAQIEHTTSEEVRKRIEEAIELSRNSDLPKAKELWASSPFGTATPTAEEFVIFLLDKINKEHFFDLS